eukprot:CAMPEP_0201537052 /NCGR_PEP_ID=MMETSP0161_2-20130828/63660_1 /ASSEMBLY_ACC=CAM_ASM_000251 /TAXON_ID=180227 /ORGANISM="Neoparamoeba aestuarina, Strain SoJaBio B1-5/56/2" /LENGTH=175 /DNA_ID=CAMNT_0047943135 /DNA_START=46 /DNA_END=573 /DNA_ORIENTATION=-
MKYSSSVIALFFFFLVVAQGDDSCAGPEATIEERNAALVTKAYKEIFAGNIPGFLEYLSDDYLYIPPDAMEGFGPEKKRLLNKAEFVEYVMEGFVYKLPNFGFQYDSEFGVTGSKEGTFTPGKYSFDHPITGEPVSSRTIHRFEIKDGKITKLYNYYDGEVFFKIYADLHPEYNY